MKRVITDTNIWYNINSEELKEISKNFKLVVPIIVINELYTSRNLWKSKETFEYLQKALTTIVENVSILEFIELDPFEYLLREIHPSIEPRLNVKSYLEEFEALTKLSYAQVKNIQVDRGDISGLTDYINGRSIGYKKLVDSNKDKFKKMDTRGYTEKYILMLANDNLAHLDNSYPRIESLNKDKFELLINTFDDIFREVSKSGKKIKDNDWVDIFNLTYAGKEDLYWTNENSKLRHVENSGCENYLFQKSYS